MKLSRAKAGMQMATSTKIKAVEKLIGPSIRTDENELWASIAFPVASTLATGKAEAFHLLKEQSRQSVHRTRPTERGCV